MPIHLRSLAAALLLAGALSVSASAQQSGHAGGAVNIPQGQDATEGSQSDTAATDGVSSWSVIALLKGIYVQATKALGAQSANGVDVGAVEPFAAATGGATPANEIVPANTTGIGLKSSAGTVYSAQLYNIGTVPLWLKIYDSATTPTCGSGTPVKRLMIPIQPTNADGSGSNISFGPTGFKFVNGLGYCVTGGIADTDTTTPTANVAAVNLDWH